jgi:hypothetical protein
MFSNPIIQRYRFSQLRPQQFWIFGTLYICILLLLLFVNASIYNIGQTYSSPRELYSAIFIQLSVIQVILVWLLMPMNCSNVVPREIADKSFDFFRMLPLSASQKATGILVGRNLFNILVASFNLCLCVLFGLIGGISPVLMLQLLILFITGAFLLSSVSLLFSVLSFRNKKPTSIPALVILAVFSFGPIVGVIGDAVNHGKITDLLVHFFNFRIPILYLISAYVLIGGSWSFAGIKRRFSREYEPLFSRTGGLSFMACYLFLVYALYHDLLINPGDVDCEFCFYSFYVITLLPLAVIPMFSIRVFDKYIEITRQSKRSDRVLGKIFFNSNLFGGILLFALWSIVTTAVGMYTYLLKDFWPLSILLFLSMLIILSLIEIHAIYSSNNQKIGYLLGFIGALYFILPLILGGLFDNDYLMMFSPFGLLMDYEMYNDLADLIPVFIVNIILLLPLFLLIVSRYSAISKLRSRIEASH